LKLACWRTLPPSGGVERALGKVRFARLIHSGARVLGGPAVRATFRGTLRQRYVPTHVSNRRTCRTSVAPSTQRLLPIGEWSGRTVMVRFVRLIHRHGRDFGALRPAPPSAVGSNSSSLR
jgi:hypothetical protein